MVCDIPKCVLDKARIDTLRRKNAVNFIQAGGKWFCFIGEDNTNMAICMLKMRAIKYDGPYSKRHIDCNNIVMWFTDMAFRDKIKKYDESDGRKF